VCHDEIRHWQDFELVSSDGSVGGEALHLRTASEVAGRQQSYAPLSPAAHGVVSVAHGRLDIVTELHTKASSSIDLASRELLQRTRAIDRHAIWLHIKGDCEYWPRRIWPSVIEGS
jgi:hypothetical protein